MAHRLRLEKGVKAPPGEHCVSEKMAFPTTCATCGKQGRENRCYSFSNGGRKFSDAGYDVTMYDYVFEEYCSVECFRKSDYYAERMGVKS